MLRRNPAGTCRASTSSCRAGGWGCGATSWIGGSVDYASNNAALEQAALQPVAEQPDVRLQPERVLPLPPAIRAGQVASRGDRQPDVPAIPDEPGRPRRAQVLRRIGMNLAKPMKWLRRRAAGVTVRTRLRRPQRPRLRAGVGRAGAGAGRRQGDRVQRHQRPAGPAPRRGQAQPDRARPQRRPAGLHRRRAGGRLAADPAAAAGNPKIQPGQPGYFEAAHYVRMLEIPARLDRAEGDVHPGGNPHIQTDPRNIALVADALASAWPSSMPPTPIITGSAIPVRGALESGDRQLGKAGCAAEGHPDRRPAQGFPYLENWLGLKQVAALEPKPGVEPSSAHLSGVLGQLQRQPAKW